MPTFVTPALLPSLRLGRRIQIDETRPTAAKAAKPALTARTLIAAVLGGADVLALSTLLLTLAIALVPASAGDGASAVLMTAAFGLLASSVAASRCTLYSIGKLLRPITSIGVAAPVFGVGILAGTLALYALKARGSGLIIGTASALAGAFLYLAITRTIASAVVAAGVASGQLTYRIVVVGSHAGQVLSLLRARHDVGLRRSLFDIVGIFDSIPSDGLRAEQATPSDLPALASTLSRERLDAIVLAYPADEVRRLQAAFSAVNSSVLDIFVLTGMSRCGVLSRSHPLSALPVLPLQASALSENSLLMKSLFDRILGTLLLLFASPIMLLTALAIRLESTGPVFFRQPRTGYDNRPFSMFKFRSMYTHLTDQLASRQTSRDDPRVTRVGRFIRRFSIDELPQLLNVVRGEMSLVGPRPHAPQTNVDGLLLEHVVDGYKLRHRVMPGITGWAQINGSRGALATPEQIERRVQLDLEYIERWSPLFDLRIIVLTAAREIFSKAAY